MITKRYFQNCLMVSTCTTYLRLWTAVIIVGGVFLIVCPWQWMTSDWELRRLLRLGVASQLRIHEPLVSNVLEHSKSDSNPGKTTVDFHLQHTNFLSDYELCHSAAEAAVRPLKSGGQQRVAFLFISRDNIPFEPLWKRFFSGNEEKYSIYVHSRPDFQFTNQSFFQGKQITSHAVKRFSPAVVDAQRRLLAHATLDESVSNAWFVFVCEATIPIRSFSFTYDYLTSSKYSFVESFTPIDRHVKSWQQEPVFRRSQLRKGEMWMAMHRRHAGTVLSDWTLYFKFASDCRWFCAPDEHYIQTMLHIMDPKGIANRTIMYVNWSGPHAGSPKQYQSQEITLAAIEDIQNRTLDLDGQHHDTAVPDETHDPTCMHNGKAEVCWLFARKFHSKCVKPLLGISTIFLNREAVMR